jgi:hypothetical protein
MVAFRQNGLLIDQNGALTPQVDDPHFWGYTITMGTVTWRSGLGLDSSGKVLYYFAGPYLNITTLAAAIARTAVQNAMELDINNYWVHFEAFHPQDSALQPDPLFKDMKDGVGRFLKPYERDFFYVTAGQ